MLADSRASWFGLELANIDPRFSISIAEYQRCTVLRIFLIYRPTSKQPHLFSGRSE